MAFDEKRPISQIVIFDAVGNPISVVDDAGTHRLGTIGKVLDASGVQINPAKQETLLSIDGKDFATETTLATKASEATLASLEAKDFATETTLATRATEATLASRATEATLALLEGKAATEATLAALEAKAATDAGLTAISGLLTTIDLVLDAINGKVATEVTLAALEAKAATEATLATRATAAAQTDGSQKSQVVDGANTLDIDATGKAGVQNPPNLDVALSTRATEATLATRASEATLATRATEATLAAIKDTDGVKKITDPLPAGANEIGKVAQGTKAAAADGWPFVLYDAAGNPVAVTLDGGIYRLETLTKIRNSSGGLINPATQETLALLEGKDFATETTLATRASEATLATRASEATLTSIKDTDGVKKITDALPIGDNWLGRVKIGDGTNIAAVVQDGAYYRLRVESVQGKPSPVSVLDAYVELAGSNDLLVDGSGGGGGPKTFTLDAAGAGTDYALDRLRFVLAADSIDHDGASFGKGSALANGVQIELRINNGTVVLLETIKINEEFAQLSVFDVYQAGFASDLMVATYVFTSRTLLVGGSADYVHVVINDDLTLGALGLSYFTCSVKAVVES